MQIQDQLAKISTAHAALVDFVAAYGDKIPDGLGGLSINYDVPNFTVSLHRDQENRLRGLQAMGDIFGRDGWRAEPSYDARSFTWMKSVKGVSIAIYGAETLPKLEPMPVPPSKFPIQLAENAE